MAHVVTAGLGLTSEPLKKRPSSVSVPAPFQRRGMSRNTTRGVLLIPPRRKQAWISPSRPVTGMTKSNRSLLGQMLALLSTGTAAGYGWNN